ncbi:rhomboid family intramembrane serine protease [Dysgonomonas sp. Marseille-P4361]|uniref:rhomboid family intramembrane serine protease n=1 Tax=Dysgonomonas sp. Marseille-P4361 TaxID=2161820 RepID=UPI000D55FD3C|nr:rhomboid family intramembrane serine protease [Dysgonomonas sp. Marseille-P4361]
MNQNNVGFMSSVPVVTKNLIIINVIFFLADTLLFKDRTLDNIFALHYFTSDSFMPHQIITCMFMHGSIGHLFFNMFAVFMFGRTLEMIWGPRKFLFYYMIAGVGASLLQLLVMYLRVSYLEASIPPEILPDILQKINTEGLSILMQDKNYADPTLGGLNLLLNGGMVGASGAIFGILVAFGMIFPNAELMLIFPPIPIKAKWFVIGYGVIELALGIADREGDNIAHFAHLGGLLTGLIILLYWKHKGKLTTKDGSFQR